MLTAAEEFNTHSIWIQYSFNCISELLQSAVSCYNLLTAATHSITIQYSFNFDSILIQFCKPFNSVNHSILECYTIDSPREARLSEE